MPATKSEKYRVTLFVTCENFEKCKNFFEVKSDNILIEWQEAENRGWLYEKSKPDRFYCPDCKENLGWDF